MAFVTIDLLRRARLRSHHGTTLRTPWHGVPDGFEPDWWDVVLKECVAPSVITATLETRRHSEPFLPPWPMDDDLVDDDEVREVTPKTQISGPCMARTMLGVAALSSQVRLTVTLELGSAGTVDVILSARVVGRVG